MSDKNNAPSDANISDSKSIHTITRAMLPLHCPLPGMSLWDSHPRVFLPIEQTGRVSCPYCGTEFVLSDERQ